MATATKKIEFFKILVDGKTFGPFPKSKQRRFQALRHRAGVKFETLYLEKPEARSQKPEARSQKPEARTAFPSRRFGLDCRTKIMIIGGRI